MSSTRAAAVQRGLWLNWFRISYNVIEAIVSIAAGFVSGSIALVGFGIDSVIEVTASGAAQWRLRADFAPARREHVERLTLRVIGVTFLALAVYVAVESVATLRSREAPDPSTPTIVVGAPQSSTPTLAVATQSSTSEPDPVRLRTSPGRARMPTKPGRTHPELTPENSAKMALRRKPA